MGTTTPTVEDWKSRFERVRPLSIAFRQTVYRSSTPAYANQTDLLTGEGSKKNGGRWNPVGVSVIYTSLTPETAMSEALAHCRYYRLPEQDAMPRTFVAIAVNLHAVVDLRDASVRKRLQISLKGTLSVDWRKEMSAGREPLTHIMGRAAVLAGLEGLIVPSAADANGQNLLVFPLCLNALSTIKLLGVDRLTS